MAETKGKCADCGIVPIATKLFPRRNLIMDHDHLTGYVRDLVCHRCNNLRAKNDAVYNLQKL
jgi:hypothetical protein